MICNYKDYLEYQYADKVSLGCDRTAPPFGGTRYKIYKYEMLLRKCEFYHNCRKSPLFYPYKLWLKYRFRQLSIKYGFEIPLNCFGKGLSIAHIGPIIINGNVKIGENCRIHVGVNIGTEAGYADHTPILGNNIYIAPGAKIFGPIQIADNVIIGANAVVNRSINTPDVSIGGIPAKIISNIGTSRFNHE